MGRIRGILLSLLGSFALGLILCRLWNLAPESALAFAAAGTLGAAAGALATGRSSGIGMAAMAAAILLSGLLGIWGFDGFLKPLVTVGLCLLTLAALTASGYGFYGPLGVYATLGAGLSMFISRSWGDSWEMAACITAISALLLTLDGFRDTSMRKSQHKNRSYRNIGNPAKIQQHSVLLVLIFLALALAAALLCRGVQSIVVAGIKALFSEGAVLYDEYLAWIKPIIDAFQAWLRSILHRKSGDGGGAGVEERDDGWKRLPYFGSAISTSIMVFCFIALCAAVSVLLGSLVIRSRMKGRNEKEIVDYEDFVEKLDRPGFLKRWQNRKKGQKLRDFDSPAMKIRFIFQQMLRRKAKDDNSAILKTPNELLDPTVTDEDILVDAYNRVKYGKGNVSNEDLAAAERYWKNL